MGSRHHCRAFPTRPNLSNPHNSNPTASPIDSHHFRASHQPRASTNQADLELMRACVPSWTSSPAARSPKTWANRHSSGCGCAASPSSPGPGGSMAAVRHAIAPRGHRIRGAPDRGGEQRFPGRRRFWNTGRCALIGGGGRRRRRRGRMGDRAEEGEERGGVGWGGMRRERRSDVGRPRSPSSVSLCVSLSLPCCACVCASSHIFLSRETSIENSLR